MGFATHHYDITILVDNATDNAKGVVSQGGQVFLTRVDIQSTASFAVMDATAEGIVTTGSATAVVVQSNVRSESPSTASYAIHNSTSNVIVQDSTILATGATPTRIGIFSDGMAANSVRVERSRVGGATNSINSGPGYTTEVLFTQLDQVVSGSVTCVAVIDESLAFNASACT